MVFHKEVIHMKKLLLCIVMSLSLAFAAFAQVDPVPTPSILVEWNEDGTMIPMANVPELTLVSSQILPGATGTHDYNFIVDTSFPKTMKWEADMPGSTPTAPEKMEIILELSALPSVNPPGRWWAKLKIQVALTLDGVTGPPSDISEKVYCIDWIGKKTGKPKRIE
jgi:hypothetical protein